MDDFHLRVVSSCFATCFLHVYSQYGTTPAWASKLIHDLLIANQQLLLTGMSQVHIRKPAHLLGLIRQPHSLDTLIPGRRCANEVYPWSSHTYSNRHTCSSKQQAFPNIYPSISQMNLTPKEK